MTNPDEPVVQVEDPAVVNNTPYWSFKIKGAWGMTVVLLLKSTGAVVWSHVIPKEEEGE